MNDLAGVVKKIHQEWRSREWLIFFTTIAKPWMWKNCDANGNSNAPWVRNGEIFPSPFFKMTGLDHSYTVSENVLLSAARRIFQSFSLPSRIKNWFYVIPIPDPQGWRIGQFLTLKGKELILFYFTPEELPRNSKEFKGILKNSKELQRDSQMTLII